MGKRPYVKDSMPSLLTSLPSYRMLFSSSSSWMLPWKNVAGMTVRLEGGREGGREGGEGGGRRLSVWPLPHVVLTSSFPLSLPPLTWRRFASPPFDRRLHGPLGRGAGAHPRFQGLREGGREGGGREGNGCKYKEGASCDGARE